MGVYKGIAQDNVTINGGTLYDVTMSGNVDSTAGYIQLRTATATEIAAIGNAVNLVGKAAGTIVFDTTNSKIKVATGATAASTWVDAAGTNAVTPA
jgi:hypothetical protein